MPRVLQSTMTCERGEALGCGTQDGDQPVSCMALPPMKLFDRRRLVRGAFPLLRTLAVKVTVSPAWIGSGDGVTATNSSRRAGSRGRTVHVVLDEAGAAPAANAIATLSA